MFSVSLLPCTDGEQAAEHAHEHAEHSNTQEHHHEEHSDTCAPFCYCDCCGVSIVQPHYIFYAKAVENIPLQNQVYYSFLYAFEFSNGVWHPPAFI